ncbi:hypothetical protein MCP_0360 [Methanocella paludicola SANAE]|uniref:HEAT repeat domain-containing protein n=1 Tax=Methanocella paludicola (strain DSM 17711 / JCM 13418 / NBRC 101707 / SANAE) TaxID=304371 RepID=D1YVG0_METPS|nr:HEAT repeat domain-containing protein [Methanocella paludicola]BAI60432.1 hypothetical protein MCP_0360 [Methanocella paludicola SANAE]
MRKTGAVLALVTLSYFSGAAGAMSAMPAGEGNPYPNLFAFLLAMCVLALGFILVDRFERQIVDRMRKANDVNGLIGALKNGWLSRKAACALGDMKADEAVEPLVDALHDPNSDVRQAAAKALGDIGDVKAIGPLRQALGDRYRGVRECAALSLKRLQKPDNAL